MEFSWEVKYRKQSWTTGRGETDGERDSQGRAEVLDWAVGSARRRRRTEECDGTVYWYSGREARAGVVWYCSEVSCGTGYARRVALGVNRVVACHSAVLEGCGPTKEAQKTKW